ncbi:hypothetical protein ACFLUJ_06830 [Chloroflexota bacterium]
MSMGYEMLVHCGNFVIRSIIQDELSGVLKLYRQCEDFLALGPEPIASMTTVMKDVENSQRENGIFCGIYHQNEDMVGVVDYVLSGYEGDNHAAFFSLLMITPSFRTN